MKKKSLIERLRAKKAAHPTVCGVTWYSAENWGRVKAAAADPERFEATFAEWQTMAEDAITDIRKTGVSPIKVFIAYEELLPWCLAHSGSLSLRSFSDTNSARDAALFGFL